MYEKLGTIKKQVSAKQIQARKRNSAIFQVKGMLAQIKKIEEDSNDPLLDGYLNSCKLALEHFLKFLIELPNEKTLKYINRVRCDKLNSWHEIFKK